MVQGPLCFWGLTFCHRLWQSTCHLVLHRLLVVATSLADFSLGPLSLSGPFLCFDKMSKALVRFDKLS